MIWLSSYLVSCCLAGARKNCVNNGFVEITFGFLSGYLAEEQLMTAYDEFLQTSPYLDVFRNEFDRIFMTSLKTILAEYRAVKIYGKDTFYLYGNQDIL